MRRRATAARMSRTAAVLAVVALTLAGCAPGLNTTSKFRTYDGPPVTGIVLSKGPR